MRISGDQQFLKLLKLASATKPTSRSWCKNELDLLPCICMRYALHSLALRSWLTGQLHEWTFEKVLFCASLKKNKEKQSVTLASGVALEWKHTVHTHRTTSTAPGRTLGSLPMSETLAAKEPSMLNTTQSIPRGSTVRKASALVWSPLEKQERRYFYQAESMIIIISVFF